MNVFLRRAAPRVRVPLFWLATPWACAWMVWVPAAHAVETEPPEQAASAPFKQYQGWRDEALQDWREANERVGEIGGWRTYLRESQIEGDAADQGHPGH
ncbi:MAG: hypothetical protein Q8L71_12150 [Thiobacillus sp.]|nr:hypothetical protein [Thiobacillus sp.]